MLRAATYEPARSEPPAGGTPIPPTRSCPSCSLRGGDHGCELALHTSTVDLDTRARTTLDLRVDLEPVVCARCGTTVRHHAEEAFAVTFALSLTLAAMAALIAAVLASWLLVRQVTRPIEALARAADTVAAGRYDLPVPTPGFSTELQRLADAYAHMAGRLADSDAHPVAAAVRSRP